MEKRDLYLGIWFQRTYQHLIELYEFFKYQKLNPLLDKSKAQKLLKGFKLKEISLIRDREFDYLVCKIEDYDFKFSEDGLLIIHSTVIDLDESKKALESFYLNKLAPILEFLFSKGAPLPKDLKVLEEIYPIYFITENYNLHEMENIKKIEDLKKDKFLSSINSKYLYLHEYEKINLVSIKSSVINKEKLIRDLIGYLIFFKEFESQIKQYLYLHRKIWEEVSVIRQSESIKFKDFSKIREKLLEFQETNYFVIGRLNQMEDILITRKECVDPLIKDILKDMNYNIFDNLIAEQKYMNHLLEITQQYVDSTFGLLKNLHTENTEKQLNTLQIVTILGALAGFFGMNIAFPWNEGWSTTFRASILVMIIIGVLSVASYFLIKSVYTNRRFKI